MHLIKPPTGYMHGCDCQSNYSLLSTRITKNYEFKKGVGIDSTIKSTETRIRLSQFSLQKFNPYFWLII